MAAAPDGPGPRLSSTWTWKKRRLGCRSASCHCLLTPRRAAEADGMAWQSTPHGETASRSDGLTARGGREEDERVTGEVVRLKIEKIAKAAKVAKATRGRRDGSGERASRSNANPTSRFRSMTRDSSRPLALPTHRLTNSHRRCPMPDYGHDLQFDFFLDDQQVAKKIHDALVA